MLSLKWCKILVCLRNFNYEISVVLNLAPCTFTGCCHIDPVNGIAAIRSLTSNKFFNMIFQWLPPLCTPHIQIIVRSLSRAVNFKHRFNHKDQRGFPMHYKEGHLLVDQIKWKKQTLNIPLSIVKLLITLWMMYQYTQSRQRYRCPSFLDAPRALSSR
jgi:hypothetical protein